MLSKYLYAMENIEEKYAIAKATTIENCIKNYLLVLLEFFACLPMFLLAPIIAFPPVWSFSCLTLYMSSLFTSSSYYSSESNDPKNPSHFLPNSSINVLGISIKRAKTLSLDWLTLFTAGKRIGIERTIITIEETKRVRRRLFFSEDRL